MLDIMESYFEARKLGGSLGTKLEPLEGKLGRVEANFDLSSSFSM